MAILHPRTVEEFQEVLANNTYVAVDFYADWCPPCKAIAPLYTKLADEKSVPDHLTFTKVNVDESPDIAQLYGVTAMPTFLFFDKTEPFTGGRSFIRGADPRSLSANVEVLSTLAQKASSTAAQAEEEA
jgi:thioredoxin 1